AEKRATREHSVPPDAIADVEKSARLKSEDAEGGAEGGAGGGANLKELEKLFQLMLKYGASDLHIKAGNPPIMRIQGKVRYFDAEAFTGERIQHMVAEILTPPQRAAFEAQSDLDFAYSLPGIGRFRLNAFRQRGSVSI